MEKHNTHIVLESDSSEKHEYKGDENGNIKIDYNEEDPYHSFIQKKPKLAIKEILIENNNLLKKEFDKNILSEEVQDYTPKKKRQKLQTDVYVKLNDYRFNVNKIQPCNEIGLNYNKENGGLQINFEDKKNSSFELKESNKKIDDENNNKKKKFKRNTMYMLNNGKKLTNLKKDKNNIKQKRHTKQIENFDKASLLKDKLEHNNKKRNNTLKEKKNFNEDDNPEEEKISEKNEDEPK